MNGTFLSHNIQKYHRITPLHNGFTIVELLVVVVVVGILAVIVLVSYLSISQRATIASLQSDLSNTVKLMRMWQAENGAYPTSIDCSSTPATDSICLKTSSNSSYVSFQSNNEPGSQTFCITEIKNGVKYKVTDDSIPEAGTCDSALTNGLIGYYPFNGDAKDYSGNVKDGTVHGAALTSGVIGQAYSFDGVDDYVEISQGHGFLTTDSTISMWIYSTSWTHRTYIAFLGSRQIGNDGVMFFVPTTGSLSCDWGSDRWYTGYTIPLNQWVHIAVTRNSAGRKLYVNGSSINSTTAAGGPVSADTVFQIGNIYGSSYYHQGKIDEVRIYDRALTADEIDTVYNL